MATYIVANHTCQLSVGTVKGVGPDEQQHSYDIDDHVVEIESHAGTYAQEYGCDGDGIGGDAEASGQACPGVAYGAIKCQVYMFLCVRAFERGAVC